jgi:UDP-glucose 4-epimerase
MRVLFTGSSSFTGMNFINKLIDLNYEVTAVFTKIHKSYNQLQKSRIENISKLANFVYGVNFGDEQFIELLNEKQYDIACFHHAEVANYKSNLFNTDLALKRNTLGIEKVTKILKKNSTKLLITRSIYEEGVGSRSINKDVGEYGLAKRLTFEKFKNSYDPKDLFSFVICNPYGKLENPKLQQYLVKMWKVGEIPILNHPYLVRDNIPIDLMAESYGVYVKNIVDGNEKKFVLAPSFRPETNLELSLRIAKLSYQLNYIRKIPKIYDEEGVSSTLEPEKLFGVDQITYKTTRHFNEFLSSYVSYLWDNEF